MATKLKPPDVEETRRIDPDRVEAVRASLPSSFAINELADIFGLLGDPSRLRLLISLLDAGELCVGDLAAAAGMNESPVSHALRLLKAHRVVEVRRAGRVNYYRLADSHVRLLLDVGLQHAGHARAVADGGDGPE